jgi:hypothetical protein
LLRCLPYRTSSLFDCFALLAVNDEPASLVVDSSFGRGIGMFDGLSEKAAWLWGRPLLGVPLKVPVVDMIEFDSRLNGVHQSLNTD